MNDHERGWCQEAIHYGGSFVRRFAQAVLAADDDNFDIVHLSLRLLMDKYPSYSEMAQRQRDMDRCAEVGENK